MWSNIIEELNRVKKIIEGWQDGSVPELEKDVVLKKMAIIYERVKFESGSEAILFTEHSDKGDEIPSREEKVESVEHSDLPEHIEEAVSDNEEHIVTRTRIDKDILDSLYGYSSAPKATRSEAMGAGHLDETNFHAGPEGEYYEDQEEPYVPQEQLEDEQPTVVMAPSSVSSKAEMGEQYAETGVNERHDDPVIMDVIGEETPAKEFHGVGGSLPPFEVEAPELLKETPKPAGQVLDKIAEGEHKSAIGDKQNGRTLSDIYAENEKKKDVAAKISEFKTVGIRSSIGINDKFLLVNELFNGDKQAYESVIERLDEFTDLDEALIYIHENFSWNPNSEGVQLLMEILTRKLS